MNPNKCEGPDGIHPAILKLVIVGGWQERKKAVNWADEWDMSLNESEGHLLANASKELAVVGEIGEFSTGASQRTKDPGTVTTADYNWAERTKGRALQAAVCGILL